MKVNIPRTNLKALLSLQEEVKEAIAKLEKRKTPDWSKLYLESGGDGDYNLRYGSEEYGNSLIYFSKDGKIHLNSSFSHGDETKLFNLDEGGAIIIDSERM